MIGGLLTSVQELSRQSIGMTVSYIQCSSGTTAFRRISTYAPQVGVTMVHEEKYKLNCTLFHATSTVLDLVISFRAYSCKGPQFGHLIAAQILRSFVMEYGGTHLRLFVSFMDAH